MVSPDDAVHCTVAALLIAAPANSHWLGSRRKGSFSAAYCRSLTHGTPTIDFSTFDLEVSSGGLMKVTMQVHRGVPAASPHVPNSAAAAASKPRAPVRTCSTPAAPRLSNIVSNTRRSSSKCHRTCAGRITKQLRRLLEAFVIRRRVVLEVKHPPAALEDLDGREHIGVEGGSQECDGESMTLLCCPLTMDGPLTIDGETKESLSALVT